MDSVIMPLIELLTLQIGPAIAKAILKLWLKDSVIAADVSSSFIDIIKLKTDDVIAQQRAKRQFEEIGEKVAEQLWPLLEADGQKLEESSQEAIVFAVVKTLAQTKFDPQIFLEKDLEPTSLAKHLLESSPYIAKDFSALELAAYQQLVTASCEYIVDIASNLPNFLEKSFAEILKRQTQLITITNEVLNQFKRLNEVANQANTKTEEARFEQEYRRAVVRNLDELELFGVSLTTAASRRHQLSVAYITLSVSRNEKGIPSEESVLILPQ